VTFEPSLLAETRGPPGRQRAGQPGGVDPELDPAAGHDHSSDQLAYLAAVVDASSDAILSKNLDGTITSWNASATRIFGFTADEMVGQNIRRLIPPELQSQEDGILAALRAGRFIDHFETVRMTKDGRRLDVSLSISPIRNVAGEIVGAAKIARDITARKQADDALAASIAKFESVFNQSGIFAGILDLNGNLREVNDLALDQCGYERDEVLGRPFWETPWWRGADWVRNAVRSAAERAAAGEVFRGRLPYWFADGTERVVDFAIHPIRDQSGELRFLHPTGIDITERERAEEVLRAREAEEREIAVGFQRALLPDRLIPPDGVSCSARYEAGSDALEVGGDWYDAFLLADGRLALTVGDVVGHGLSAAVSMGQLRTALRALAEYAGTPSELLTRLDRFAAQTGTTDFATVCFGLLDPVTGVFEYASAGHPPMLLVSPAGETRWLDGAGSPPLGGDEHVTRPEASIVLEPGSLLVLYSDGLIERRGELIEHGLERLARAGAQLVDAATTTVCERLVMALGAMSAHDDVAVLAVRFEPVRDTVFRRVFPARADELRGLRAAMRAWLDEQRIGEPALSDLLLAVGEACANAVEHAYLRRATGAVSVVIEAGAGPSLEVAVRDFGQFRVPSLADNRSRGSTIMRELTTDFSRDSDAAGTTVRFRLPIDRPAVPA
jgi:PAS domain S-box-containing protein